MARLIDITAAKAYCNINTGDTVQDGLLYGLIEHVSTEFQTDCGWNILTGTITLTFRGNGTPEYTFGMRPVTAVTSLATNTDFDDDTWTALATTEYKLRNTGGGRYYLRYPGVFDCNTEYRAIITAGYAADAVPGDIQETIGQFVSALYYMSPKTGAKGYHIMKTSRTSASVTTTDEIALPWDRWNKTVNAYKIQAC